VCAQPAQTDTSGAPPSRPRRGAGITPIQWVGLAVLVLLLLNQLGLLRFGAGGIDLGALQSQFPRWLALVVGITVHEFSHGLVATWFGDTVPRRAGRLTLNPLKHLDPLGTLMILVGPIGWGRPMPINPAGMRNPNLGWALSSAAGPISNVIVATLTVIVVAYSGLGIRNPYILELITLNLGLAVFNLVPLPPLDGFGFVFGLAPRPLKIALAPIWQIGPLALLALLFLPEFVPGFPPILQELLGRAMGYLTGLLLEVYRAI
jgi:Zn-dependent protease